MPPTPLIAENIAGHIAFGLGANSVRSVMVNGVMIYEDRQFSFDCEPIFREAQKVAKKCGRAWMPCPYNRRNNGPAAPPGTAFTATAARRWR
jgi:cytosine/adenosine deaminase-related metal-dependent hydrolase